MHGKTTTNRACLQFRVVLPLAARRGFTLVELLVVIALIGIALALLLPAVQAVRETARSAECKNHLRQIGRAFAMHHDTHSHFPTNGWGWQWVGDADRGYDWKQPGGWCFNVLPYLEQAEARKLATGGISTAELLQTPLPVWHCPSRRRARAYPWAPSLPPLVNSSPVSQSAKTDYAVCGGDEIIHTPAGPPSSKLRDLKSYSWPAFHEASGVAYVLTQISISQVTDGTSNTALVGEKYLSRLHYDSGRSLGDDQTAYLGDDADIRRWTDRPPKKDAETDDIQHFGSAHVAGCYFVLCDGSVRYVDYEIDEAVFKNFGNRHDNIPFDWPD